MNVDVVELEALPDGCCLRFRADRRSASGETIAEPYLLLSLRSASD